MSSAFVAMAHEGRVLRRIRLLTALFIAALVISGATAIPLRLEVDQLSNSMNLAKWEGAASKPALAGWLLNVRDALRDMETRHPFLFYGTDWLAFGHVVIAIAFIGALRDPVRNIWLFRFGIIACVLVVPYALAMGALRGIPLYWRLIDCSFGVFGLVPLIACLRWARALALLNENRAPALQ